VILVLRGFFIVVLASMLSVTTWASLKGSVFAIPHEVSSHPWFIATLFDTYWAFFTFYVWLAYKETSWIARVLWFVAIVLLGNIAMAVYGLIQVFRVPADSALDVVLLRSRPVSPAVPAVLVALIVAIGLFA
jgi:hypothetical protein